MGFVAVHLPWNEFSFLDLLVLYKEAIRWLDRHEKCVTGRQKSRKMCCTCVLHHGTGRAKTYCPFKVFWIG